MESLFMENPKTSLPDELLGIDMPKLKDSNDKRRIRFIINPSSGVRKKIRMEQVIEQEIDRDLFDFD